MSDNEKPSAEAAEVRRLAGEGMLARRYLDGSEAQRRRLRAGAGEISAPLVFRRMTRPHELRRGHYRCAAGLQQLAPDCLDRFHLDLDAVLEDLFSHADLAIDNLEGWLTMRMNRAVVDAYRHRRGARGAAQRPRVPGWLKDALGNDPWLIELARLVMEWVGIDATAGGSLWPLTAWAERRAVLTGVHSSDEAAVAKDVETVLAAMRRRPTWYQNTIERPLGHKPAPVWFPAPTDTGAIAEPEPLDLNPQHERDDALLQELATTAIELITRRIDRGEDPAVVVPDVLVTVFGAVPASYGLDRSPTAIDAGPDPEQVTVLIADSARLDLVIATVLSLMLPAGDQDDAP